MLKYESLSDALSRRIEAEKRTGSFERMGFENSNITRRNSLKRMSEAYGGRPLSTISTRYCIAPIIIGIRIKPRSFP